MSFSKLDREMIVREAVALLNEDGLGGVSLRKVAGRLDVSVSSLYWHVKDKDALYGLMAGSIFQACLDAIPQSGHWRQWLHEFGVALWNAQTSVRDARQLIAVTRPEPGMSEIALEKILGPLRSLGLPDDEARTAQRSVQALVTGWTTLWSARPGTAASDKDSFIVALDVLIDGWAAHLAAR